VSENAVYSATAERSYFRARAAEEKDAAERSSCIVRDVHLELLELYTQADAELAARAPAGHPE
jgi:hypothetical protein